MIIKQFKVAKLVKYEFLAYVFFTLILGQTAIYLPIIITILNEGDVLFSYKQMIASGSLYNTIIPLLGTVLYAVIYDIAFTKNGFFNNYKIFVVTINILLIFFCSSFYTNIINSSNRNKEILQWFIYAISIYFFLTSYFTQFLHLDMKNFKDIVDNNADKIQEKARTRKSDNEGIKL